MFINKYPLQLHLQFFAADTGGGAGDPGSDKDGDADKGANKGGQGGTDPVFTPDQQAQIDKMIEKAQDKVRDKYGKQVKDLETTVEQLKNAGKSKEELASEKEQQLQQRESELLAKHNEFHALKALAEAKLATKFLEFVVTNEGLDEEARNAATDAKIKALKDTMDAAVAEQVEAKFKELGYKPGAGTAKTGNAGFTSFSDVIKKNQIKK